MSRFVVRAARVADLAALRRLWQQIDGKHARLAPTFFTSGERGVAATEIARILADADRRLLVAEEPEGLLVGVVDLRVYDTPADRMLVQRRRAHIDELVVDRAHRRQGVGRALMEQATAWCQRRGATHVSLSVWAGNEAAERFYHELGYVEVNRVLGLELTRG